MKFNKFAVFYDSGKYYSECRNICWILNDCLGLFLKFIGIYVVEEDWVMERVIERGLGSVISIKRV